MSRKILFAAAAFGATVLCAPAFAQDEEIQVTAPHFRAEHTPLNAPLEKVSLSDGVYYGDLNLRTRSGARELKLRVRDKAQEVCTELAEAYPVKQANGTSCYKDALNDGLIRADAVISDARWLDSYND